MSGKQNLAFSGSVVTSAPRGRTGTLLLDPGNLYVGANPGSGITSAGNTGTPPDVVFNLETAVGRACWCVWAGSGAKRQRCRLVPARRSDKAGRRRRHERKCSCGSRDCGKRSTAVFRFKAPGDTAFYVPATSLTSDTKYVLTARDNVIFNGPVARHEGR